MLTIYQLVKCRADEKRRIRAVSRSLVHPVRMVIDITEMNDSLVSVRKDWQQASLGQQNGMLIEPILEMTSL